MKNTMHIIQKEIVGVKIANEGGKKKMTAWFMDEVNQVVKKKQRIFGNA